MTLNADQERRAMYLAKCIDGHNIKTPRPIQDAARELIYLRDEVERLKAIVKRSPPKDGFVVPTGTGA